MHAVDDQRTRRTTDPMAGLVARARGGDADAFEGLVRALQGPLRAFARRMMADVHLGDDAAQEAFVRMWRGIGGFRDEPDRFLAWAYTVARNTCIELIRKETRVPTPVAELPEPAGADPATQDDLRGAVREAVDALGEPYRSTLLLREAGLAYDEISVALDCPVGTVRSRLHEARRLLKLRLAPLFFGGER